MVVNSSKIENQARKLAAQAKPGIVKHGEKLYTLVFNQNEWVYDVYEDGFFLLKFNTKKVTEARKWLKEYLES